MTSSVTLPDSRKLSYSLDTAPVNGPLVVLSNSLCAQYTAWDHVVAALNKNGFRTLRYDQPGHGQSSPTKPLDTNTFDLMAEDVYFLLQELGIASVHGWIGVSLGAATGIYFVTMYPGVVRKLAICDTISCSPANAGIDDAFGPRVAAARTAGHMEGIVQATLERWFGTAWLSANPGEAARMRNLMMRTSIDGFESCCAALRSQTFDLRPLFGKVGDSVEDAICVVGEKDANLPESMSKMKDDIQAGFVQAGKATDTQLKIIKNAGHVCFIDGFAEFVPTMISFLTS